MSACLPAGLLTPGSGRPGGQGNRFDSGATATAPANGRTLLAIYMVGSDLEDDVAPRDGTADETASGARSTAGAGSNDLRELLKGFESLSPDERQNVDLVVAFGGSRKAGWQGVKVVDLAGLRQDATDNYFGNDGAYLYEDATADMAQQATFQDFLRRVRVRGQGAGKVIFDVWDHGGSYDGVGFDTPNQKILSLDAMRQALRETEFRATIIGFDACLMASVEVAAMLRGHADYLLASEELEPAHGWNYTDIITCLGKQPRASATDVGRTMVDSFIDSPSHQKTRKRTLSLTDLSQVEGVVDAVNGLAGALVEDLTPQYQAVLDTIATGNRYGDHGSPGSEYSVDLYQFAASLGGKVPSLSGTGALVTAALGRAVVYARESGDRPNSRGLTIASVGTDLLTDARYHAGNAASSAWLGFVKAFITRSNDDKEAPDITDEKPDGTDGRQMTITDNIGVNYVQSINAVVDDRLRARIIKADDMRADGTTYRLPSWDGRALYLADSAGQQTLVPVAYDSQTSSGTTVFAANAQWNNLDVTVYLDWDAAAGSVVDSWVVPVGLTDAGPSLAEKVQFPLLAGDVVAFYTLVIDTNAGTRVQALGSSIFLASDPIWNQAPVPGKKVTFALATDLKRNTRNSSVQVVP